MGELLEAFGFQRNRWGSDGSGHAMQSIDLMVRQTREWTMKFVDSLSEDDLDKTSGKAARGFEDTFVTCRLCLQYLADHWHITRYAVRTA